jgi:hypothetical protein
MAQLLVSLVDVVSDDPVHHAALPKRGDVLVVLEDGLGWGCEPANPDWLVLEAPGVAAAALADLLGPELPDDPVDPSPVLRFRQSYLDLDQLEADVPLTLEALAAAKRRRASLPDPRVFGSRRNLIG